MMEKIGLSSDLQAADQVAERRIDAYIMMLKEIYNLDEYGLADKIGMRHAAWTRNRRAPFGEKRQDFIMSLASITGMRMGWLMAEETR